MTSPRPRAGDQIETVEQLDALPVGSVVVDAVDTARMKRNADSYMGAGWTDAGRSPLWSNELADGRPMRVLHIPGDQPRTPEPARCNAPCPKPPPPGFDGAEYRCQLSPHAEGYHRAGNLAWPEPAPATVELAARVIHARIVDAAAFGQIDIEVHDPLPIDFERSIAQALAAAGLLAGVPVEGNQGDE